MRQAFFSLTQLKHVYLLLHGCDESHNGPSPPLGRVGWNQTLSVILFYNN